MKNLFVLILTLALAVSLIGCASNDAPAQTIATETPATETTDPTTFSYPTEPDGSIKQGRVPNVVGRDAEFAQLDMKSAGFVHIRIEEVNMEAAEGTVVEQNLEAYITLPVDTEVVLYVSTGVYPVPATTG